jgi:hypothetical protein
MLDNSYQNQRVQFYIKLEHYPNTVEFKATVCKKIARITPCLRSCSQASEIFTIEY